MKPPLKRCLPHGRTWGGHHRQQRRILNLSRRVWERSNYTWPFALRRGRHRNKTDHGNRWRIRPRGHYSAGSRYKPAIRIFKNLRRTLVDRQVIEKGMAPSYFIEGLLFDVLNDRFDGDRSRTVYNILDWLHRNPARSDFVCANQQYYLLRDNDSVCWPIANATRFINAAIDAWNKW